MTAQKAELSLLLLALIWGSTFVLMEDAIQWIPPLAFLTIRFALATLGLLVIVLIRQPLSLYNKTLWLVGTILGGLLALGFALQIFSLLSTTSGNSAFFTSASVAIVPIFSLLMLATPLSSRFVFSLSIVIIGLFLLSGSQLSNVNYGDLLAFMSAFAFALQIVCLKKWGTALPVFPLVTIQMLFATLFCGVAALVVESWQQALHPVVLSQPSVWLAIVICSLLATVGAYVLQAYVQRYTTPNRVALILTAEPVFAASIDYLWNGVTITDWRLLGCCLVMIGMIWGQSEKEPAYSSST